MTTYIKLSSILAVNKVAHMNSYVFKATGQATGTRGSFIFRTKDGSILHRVANFDKKCGIVCFYWVKVGGKKYRLDYPVERVEVSALNNNWFNQFPHKRPDDELIKIARQYKKEGVARNIETEYNMSLLDVMACVHEGECLLEIASEDR